jgi:hypothetical protein
MPTVLRSGPYRFFFYSGDRKEPPHIHVERDDSCAKFWLNPVRLQASGGFGRAEITKLEATVVSNETQFLREWHAYFGS